MRFEPLSTAAAQERRGSQGKKTRRKREQCERTWLVMAGRTESAENLGGDPQSDGSGKGDCEDLYDRFRATAIILTEAGSVQSALKVESEAVEGIVGGTHNERIMTLWREKVGLTRQAAKIYR